ncbi:MAG: alpha/beta fold hydrolase [Saprospiraceae bacterium]
MQLNHKTIGSGDPLVILHGLFGMLDNWQTLGKRFGESRMSVLVDQRNHGKSPHADEVDYTSLAEDLEEFLEDNWMHEADILGHSMGGKVAMQYALSFPDRVRKLVVVDMGVKQFPRGHDEIFAAMRSIPLEVIAGEKPLTRTQIDEILAERIDEPGIRMFLMKNLRRNKQQGYEWKMNLDALDAGYDSILEAVTGEPWPGDALFIRGGKSGYIKDEDWAGIQALFPNARLETIEGAGHWVHAEAPDEVYRITEDFLK